MIDTAVGRTAITFRTLELWSHHQARVSPSDFSASVGRFYLRLCVEDHPGVMAKIAGGLGQHNISIASVIQHEAGQRHGDIVPLVIMTHETTEGQAQGACDDIDRLSCIRGQSVRMRVRD